MNRSLTVIASSVINMNDVHSWRQETLDNSAARDDIHNKRPAMLISARDVFASHCYEMTTVASIALAMGMAVD
jgi:hypothetical protein